MQENQNNTIRKRETYIRKESNFTTPENFWCKASKGASLIKKKTPGKTRKTRDIMQEYWLS